MVGGTQKLESKLINLSHKRFFVDPTEKRIVDGEITPESDLSCITTPAKPHATDAVVYSALSYGRLGS